jgi:hypothetical protein
MVEADSHLKLFASSTLKISQVFENIDMLIFGIWQKPQTDIPSLLRSGFVNLGHLCSQNDVIVSWLRLTATSNNFLHPH